MDLALAIVEEDFGKTMSISIAKELVIYYKRPGGQKQFSDLLESQIIENDQIRFICEYINRHLSKELSVDLLADLTHMSARNFSRVFSKQLNLVSETILSTTLKLNLENL